MGSYTPRTLKSTDTDWQVGAACTGMDPNIFFVGGPIRSDSVLTADRSRAKAVCKQCPVRIDCLEYALANNIGHGTWGGLNEDERASLRRKRMRAARKQEAVR